VMMRTDAPNTHAAAIFPHLRRLLPAAMLLLPWLGCTPAAPPPLSAPYPYPRSLVVAPLVNHSPSAEFDLLEVTDTLVAELSQVKGLTVLPTNRALAVLRAHGLDRVGSVDQAVALAQALGVDGVLVGAITEYKPYTPQVVGMTLQLHWVRADRATTGIDPAYLSRDPRGGSMAGGGPGPGAQVSAVLDAGSGDVTERVRRYANGRAGQDSAFGWRRYLVDSDAYMHFVCNEMIVRLLDQELRRITMPVPR